MKGRTRETHRFAWLPCHSEEQSRDWAHSQCPPYWFYHNEHYGSHNWPFEGKTAPIGVHFLKCMLLKEKLLPSWWDTEKTNILLKIHTDTHRLFNNKKCVDNTKFTSCYHVFLYSNTYTQMFCSWDGYKRLLSLH